MAARVLRWPSQTDARAVKLLTWTSRLRRSLRWLMSRWDALTCPGSGPSRLIFALAHPLRRAGSLEFLYF